MSHTLSWTILKHFSCKTVYGFTNKDVYKAFPDKSKKHLARLLADMVKKGMLYRIARNVYHIIPMNAVPETYVPDGLRAALYLMKDKEYYIGYASALKVHGLLLHPEKETAGEQVYIVSNRRMIPGLKKCGSITFHFILQDKEQYFGYTSLWINREEKAMVSDLEKTIVDLATKPYMGEGILELANAIFKARGLLNYDRLFYYLSRNRSKVAKKRILYLTDLLGLGWTSQHEKMLAELGSGVQLLDPSAPEHGKRIGKFGLRINIDPKLIKQKILH